MLYDTKLHFFIRYLPRETSLFEFTLGMRWLFLLLLLLFFLFERCFMLFAVIHEARRTLRLNCNAFRPYQDK